MNWKYISLIFIVLLPFGSCRKYYEGLIAGRWERVYADVKPDRPKAIWTFYEDGTFSVENDESWGSTNGSFSVTTKSVIVPIVNISDPFRLEGKYQCDKVSKKILTMTRREHAGTTDSAFWRMEFVKAE